MTTFSRSLWNQKTCGREFPLRDLSTNLSLSIGGWKATMTMGLRPNYAMQRSSRVVTPLAEKGVGEDRLLSASGAPTARRR
jgi:hypothetical protein